MTHSKGFILFVLSVAQFLGLSLWFATNAVLDQIQPEFNLSNTEIANLSIVVTVGFVSGGIFSSVLNLSDIIETRKIFFLSALIGGAANLLIVLLDGPNYSFMLFMRFLTGFALAGIYPVGMKLVASHYKENRGLAIGVLLGALTIGSGLPYLFRIYGAPEWEVLITIVAILSILGGILVLLLVEEGPFVGKSQKFDLNAVKTIYSKRSVRLANYGYFGHMWELYAMWIWFPIMLRDSFETAFPNKSENEIIYFYSIGTFLVFLSGGLGNALGGYISDRIGRTTFTIMMLSLSGLCGLLIGFFYSFPYIIFGLGILWGFAIVPDSPQYSTMVSEVSDQDLVGSALTIQTALGFALTVISIKLLPLMENAFTWKYAFMLLPIGPVLGIYSMLQLRKEPDAKLIASGKM